MGTGLPSQHHRVKVTEWRSPCLTNTRKEWHLTTVSGDGQMPPHAARQALLAPAEQHDHRSR